jgi:hypothetical protein
MGAMMEHASLSRMPFAVMAPSKELRNAMMAIFFREIDAALSEKWKYAETAHSIPEKNAMMAMR